MKVYSLVGKKLLESTPEELEESMIGMIVDVKDEMIRLILTKDARKKQRELLMQLSAEFNKKEYAGTYLVSQLENPDLIKSILKEVKNLQSKEETEDKKEAKKKKPKSKKKKKEDQIEPAQEESNVLDRWDPDLVKKTVAFLDGKDFVNLIDIQEEIDVSEGETYWLTQDLIHSGILPGRWTGYPDGQWVYQVLSEQPLAKTSKSKSPAKKKSAKKASKKSKKKD